MRPPRRTTLGHLFPWLAAAAVVAVALTAGRALQPVVEIGVSRLSLTLPEGVSISLRTSPVLQLAISRDGRQVAYVGASSAGDQLYVRTMERLESTPLPGAAGADVRNPFFSPDGAWIGFFVGGDLRKVRTDGQSAPVTLVSDISALAPWGTWRGNEIVYSNGRVGLFAVSADGGPSALLLAPRDDSQIPDGFFHPLVIERTGDVLFDGGFADDPGIGLLNARTGERTTLLEGARLVALTPSSHLVFERDEVLMAATFDVVNRRLGPGLPVLSDVAQDRGARMPQVAVSSGGTLAYVRVSDAGSSPTLAWVDEAGALEPIGTLPAGSSTVSLSPDGAFAVIGSSTVPRQVHLWDFARRTATRLDVHGDNPRWHPDGIRIAVGGEGLLRLFDPDTTRTMAIGNETAGRTGSPSWTADGDTIVYTVREPTQDIVAILPGGSEPVRVVSTPAQETAPAVSPDGRWLAYVSDQTGRAEVFVVRFPSGTGRRQVSANGGYGPVWSRDGGRLFYLEQAGSAQRVEMHVVDIAGDESLSVGRSRSLFPVVDPALGRRLDLFVSQGTGYDVSLDGTRLLMVWVPDRPHTEIVVVQNWATELARLAPTD